MDKDSTAQLGGRPKKRYETPTSKLMFSRLNGDVYKRQGLIKSYAWYNADSDQITVGSNAVSYTHLDVYKRQHIYIRKT